MRRLTEEAKALGKPELHKGERIIHPRPLRREDFVQHGLTENCLGDRALLSGSSHQGHSQCCRFRVEQTLWNTGADQRRIHRQTQKDDDKSSRKLDIYVENDTEKT